MGERIFLEVKTDSTKKRIMAIILAIILLLSMVPQTVYAADIRSLMNAAELQPKENPLFEPRLSEILAECGYGREDTYTVFKNCYDWLIHNVRYRTEEDEYDFRSMSMTYTYDQVYINAQAFAPFYQGVGVCNEYAGALYIMAQAIGFQPYYCVGEVRKSGGGYTGHAWMALELDQKLYMFDPQVEDNVAKGGKINYYYFGKTLDELGGSHILDRDAFMEFKRVNARYFIEGEVPVYHAGIPLYIDAYPMDTYAVDGVLYIFAGDLKQYGFASTWNGKDRTLNISNEGLVVRNGNCYHPERPEWTEVGTARNSDMKVYLNGEKVPTFVAGNRVLIPIGYLALLGEMSSDDSIPEVYLNCAGAQGLA